MQAYCSAHNEREAAPLMDYLSADSLEVLGEEVAAALGPGPRVGVVIQHARHDLVVVAGSSVRLALGLVVVRHVQSATCHRQDL